MRVGAPNQPQWVLRLTHIIEIAMALVSIAVLLLRLFTAAKSAKLMSPGAQFNHQIQIEAFCPRARGEALFPISRGASHRQFEVLMLSVDLCLMTQENGLT